MSITSATRSRLGEHLLAQVLLRLVRRDPERVIVLRVEEQLQAVAAQGPLAPFELADGIGRAGERVARQLHDRTFWFPVIRRLDIWREEDGRGGYRMVSVANPVEAHLHELGRCRSLAVVDIGILRAAGVDACMISWLRRQRD
jgi:hypothetical protein